MSSLATIPPALLAIAVAVGAAVLGVSLLALLRLPEGRHRTAWRLWCAALALDVAAATIGTIQRVSGIGVAPGVVEAVLALAAVLGAVGVVARLPAGAVVASHLVLDQVPLVLAVVAVASVTYGGVVDDSPAHVVTHVLGPAAFILLGSVCLEGIHYVGGRRAPRSAKLLTGGFLLTALAGISPAFVADPSTLAYPRIAVWVAGLALIGAGAAMRARNDAEAGEYEPRPTPISGWSWGAALGVVVLVLLVLLHRGPEDALRQVAAVLALGAFAARSTIARRQSARLLRHLNAAERRYRDTIEGVNLLALQLDVDGRVTFCNDHVCEVTGWPREELVGRRWYETVGPVERQREFLEAIRTDGLEDGSEERLRTRHGSERVILWWDTVSRDDSGAVIGVNSIGQDVTDRRHAEERLAFLHHHDELTGLPNRTSFTEQLGRAIDHAAVRDRSVGVAFVNIENFRAVNDAYGHAVGDAVLCQLADRLRAAVDSTTLVSRHGGDEFILLLADMKDDARSSSHAHPADVAQMATALGGRIRHALQRPFLHGGHELYLSARSGTAVYPADADGADDLLKTAHVRAYRAPAVAQGRVAGAALAPRDELDLIARMHHAIDGDEFVLHYQPVVDLASGGMTGVEALIRWQVPGEAVVPPNEFIPIAERTGLIAPITQWVIEQVSAQKAEWRRRGIELDIGFNFPVGLWDRSTLLTMLAVMRRHGLDPGDIVIEVTESAAVMDVERSAGAIDVVREHGVRLAIDDFGTGYSSLARLGRLPVSVLKVDRTFVHGLPHEPTTAELTRHIIQLAHGLGMHALAEGIETEEQRAFLAGLGCDLGQGFLFARPVPVAEIETMLDGRGHRAA